MFKWFLANQAAAKLILAPNNEKGSNDRSSDSAIFFQGFYLTSK